MSPVLVVRKRSQTQKAHDTVAGGQTQAGILHPDQQHRHLFPLEGADDRIHGEVIGGF